MRPHRRHILTGLAAGVFASATAARAQPGSEAARWLTYNDRLNAGLEGAVGFDPEAERRLRILADDFRGSHGRGRLADHTGLARAARAHLADMAMRGYFGHRSPDGFHPSERVGLLVRDLCGFSGENLAEVFGAADQGPEAFMRMWRESPGHRENLLRPDYDHVGSAVARVGDRTWAAQVFAQATIRLAGDAPLRVADADGLRAALAGADPAFDRFQLSAPEGEATLPARTLEEETATPAGVWRLRPHLQTGADGPIQRYDVLWGPIFIA